MKTHSKHHVINCPKKQRQSLRTVMLDTAVIVIGLCSASAFAADLIDVYKQALVSDPTFKASRSEWLAYRENLPISRANLLPLITATGSINRSYNRIEGASGIIDVTTGTAANNVKYYDNNANYSLNLTQPIFNFSYWAKLSTTKAQVRSAEAKFFSSAQDLMFRTASAYFSVLQAQDDLYFTREQKKAVGEQLHQQQQRYAVGLNPITDVNEAQAKYDGIVAQEIAAQNNLQDQEEKLQEITGIRFPHLSVLSTNLPLITPVPQNIEQWVNKAVLQNYSLLGAKNDTLAARENVFTQAAGHFPVLNATGAYEYNYDSNVGIGKSERVKTAVGGLSLSVPIFQGGATSALTQQAGFQYQQAISVQEKTYRSVVSQTRQAYLGVVSGISKIKADRQAVKSKSSALESTLNAYAAGMRTMVDVLQAETDLYDSEKTYSHDQYAYILQTLSLKQQAGLLSGVDLQEINKWLRLEKKHVGYRQLEKKKAMRTKVHTKAHTKAHDTHSALAKKC